MYIDQHIFSKDSKNDCGDDMWLQKYVVMLLF